MPAVGSSTKMSSGLPMIAMAKLSLCCCPPDSRRYGVRPSDWSPRRSTSRSMGSGLACRLDM